VVLVLKLFVLIDCFVFGLESVVGGVIMIWNWVIVDFGLVGVLVRCGARRFGIGLFLVF